MKAEEKPSLSTKRQEVSAASPERNKEKTPDQKEILRMVVGYAKERMEMLGVPFHGVEEDHFIFSDDFRFISSGEWTHDDYVYIRANAEANLGIIIHEAFHYFSSEYYSKGKDLVEKERADSRRDTRSGFHGVFYREPTENDSRMLTATFKLLNEAVTEKMTREIVFLHPEALETLNRMFVGRREECLGQIEIMLKETRDKFEAETETKVNSLITEHKQELLRLLNEMKTEGVREEDIKKFKTLEEGRIEQLLITMTRMYLDFWEIHERLFTGLIEETKKNYSFSAKRDSYNPEVGILNALLHGLAIVKSREMGISMEEARDICWKEMQVAYLTGNIMHLREIDRTFGVGTLRKMNEISPMDEEEKQLFAQKIKSKTLEMQREIT